MQRLDWNQLDEAAREAALARPANEVAASVGKAIAGVFARVRAEGDAALLAFRAEFDGVDEAPLAVDVAAALEGALRLPDEDLAAIRTAAANIRAFHEAQAPREIAIETMPGVRCRQVHRPIGSVGLYVPGGTAPLVSTLLMLAVPAAVAGVGRIVLATPPRGPGLIEPAILEAAAVCGIETIYAVGGPAAIAAMALGTESLLRVDKILGPGNVYVTEAKRFAAGLPGGPAIDLPAGPSEVLVIADADADAAFVAADLLSQAEHDTASQVLLVTPDAALAEAVEDEVAAQLADLPRRDIAAGSLENARVVLVPDLPCAVAVANRYAPEHLILSVAEPEALVAEVTTAGSVFLGNWTPEAAGDYASGTNHVLPTGGAARAYGGLSLAAFMRSMTVQELSAEGLKALGPAIERLADLEGLEAHRRSVALRAAKLGRGGRAA